MPDPTCPFHGVGRSLALAAALSLGGCASPSAVRSRNGELHHDAELARQSGAYRCAPNELALGEANLDFSERELAEGHPSAARRFTDLAAENLAKARDLSKDCGPKQVVIAEPKVELKIEEKDTDNDGVPDNIDQCPTVPGPKENNGCPYGDRDNDGVPDNLDQCPDVPGPKENNGCPYGDRDHDGIPDNLDLCPDVPGVPEEHGCPRKYTLVVVKNDRIEIKQQVHFATNKWKILPDSFALLGQVAQVLKDNPQMRVLVEGHTDKVGSVKKNVTLSQRRAESVVTFVVGQGIDPGRMEAKGFGPNRPLASNSSAIGRAQNRRVEFHILPGENPPAPSAPAPSPSPQPPSVPAPEATAPPPPPPPPPASP
jgi:outer membrane protein OmpA-like peptidoglycan-associated protein